MITSETVPAASGIRVLRRAPDSQDGAARSIPGSDAGPDQVFVEPFETGVQTAFVQCPRTQSPVEVHAGEVR
ncbi:hypothetical protein [Pseudonocardia spinosispora]|uniref:hypothetical protein n=1 Tax=Pseudonocardia spinosispora TaxID=103441 RepID=UPI00048AF36D|nr:hypothetical protein [Pseudonocardia spinosispora]